MIKPTKRATIYMDEDLHKCLKMKAAECNRSVSDLVNEAVRHELAEELEDLEIIKERLHEPTVPLEQFLKALKKDGKI